jgi:outer membrane lipoprotein-sorting protein
VRKILFTLILILAGMPTASFSADLQKVLKQKYAPTQSLYVEFEQSMYWNVREKTTRHTGSLMLAPGNKFNVALAKEFYVSNGTVCWHYSKNTNQVNIRHLRDLDLSIQPSYLLTTFLDKYRFTEKERTKQQVILAAGNDTLANQEYSKVTITVQLPSGTVTALSFTDKNSNVQTYTFKKTVFDKKYVSQQFEFEVPPDAEVIDHRK